MPHLFFVEFYLKGPTDTKFTTSISGSLEYLSIRRVTLYILKISV